LIAAQKRPASRGRSPFCATVNRMVLHVRRPIAAARGGVARRLEPREIRRRVTAQLTPAETLDSVPYRSVIRRKARQFQPAARRWPHLVRRCGLETHAVSPLLVVEYIVVTNWLRCSRSAAGILVALVAQDVLDVVGLSGSNGEAPRAVRGGPVPEEEGSRAETMPRWSSQPAWGMGCRR